MLVPELPLDEAVHGYSLGTSVLTEILPEHSGPTETVPVSYARNTTDTKDGVYAKDIILSQTESALGLIKRHQPDAIFTVGGECSASVAPFTYLADKYPRDLAVIWVDAHPNFGTPESDYKGYHAMALSHIVGYGDPEILEKLPVTLVPHRVAISGLHAWTADDIPHAKQWGIQTFSPEDIRHSTDSSVNWLKSTGVSKVAIHLDVDVIDSDEVTFGLGAKLGGLKIHEAQKLLLDISATADVVGFTVAEYIPRQAMQMQRFAWDFPLLGKTE